MFHSKVHDELKEGDSLQNLLKVKSIHYLNRHPFYIEEKDDLVDALYNSSNPYRYRFEDICGVSELSQTYRYGVGVSYPQLGLDTKIPARIEQYRVPGYVPWIRQYLISEESVYKYYISPTISTSGNPSTTGEGFLPASGSYLGRPRLEYFDQERNPMCLPANSVVIKWNTGTTMPSSFKVFLKMRPVDSNAEPTWQEVYNYHLDGRPSIKTGERYGVSSAINSDGETTRIQLAKMDYTITNPSDKSKKGARRAWSSNDYLDFSIGDKIVIRNVDNSVNGVGIVKDFNRSEGWVEVYSNYKINVTANIHNTNIEVYNNNPGEFTIFRQEDGSWGTRENLYSESNNNLVSISGVRVDIIGVDRRATRAEMIELSPTLQADLSERTRDVSIVEELSEREVNIPIGTVSANTGNITLDNSDNAFDKNNVRREVRSGVWEGSHLAQVLDSGVEMRIDNLVRSYNTNRTDTIPFTPMITDSWPEGDGESIDVQMLDYSSILQQRQAPDIVLRKYPITAIITTLLDKAGFARTLAWPETSASVDSEPVIEYFWCRKEDKVWDVIQDLAKSTQTTVFFDRFGNLRVLPLPVAFDRARGQTGKNVHKLTNSNVDKNLSNIYELSKESSVPATNITVKYKPIALKGTAGTVARDVFWLPPEDYTMSVNKLSTNIYNDSTYLSFYQDKGAPPFPRYIGHLDIGGAIVRYEGIEAKINTWYSNNNAQETRLIKSDTERQRATMDNNGKAPTYTGRVKLAPKADEQFANKERFLAASGSGFTFIKYVPGKTGKNTSARNSFYYDAPGGAECIVLNSNNDNTYTSAYRDVGFVGESFMLKFKVDRGQSRAGSHPVFTGITLFPQTHKGDTRAYHVGVYVGDDSGTTGKQPMVRAHRVQGKHKAYNLKRVEFINKGQNIGLPVTRGTWNWLEVKTRKNKGVLTLEVYLNGLEIGTFKDIKPASYPKSEFGSVLNRNNRAGFFVKNGKISVDRFIAVDIPKLKKPPKSQKAKVAGYNLAIKVSDITYFSKSVTVAANKKKKIVKHVKAASLDNIYGKYLAQLKKRRSAKVFAAEFNDVVKQYIEEDVRFEKGPALSAQITNMNPNVAVDRIAYTPFGANFRLRNKSNVTQFLSGDNEKATSTGSVTQEQYLAITGNSITQGEAEITVTAKDYEQRLGEYKLDVETNWIQYGAQAEKLGQWIIENQGDGGEIYQATVYGNQTIELADQVDIDYYEKGLMSGKQRFIVIQVENTVSSGVETQLLLRRIFPKGLTVSKTLIESKDSGESDF